MQRAETGGDVQSGRRPDGVGAGHALEGVGHIGAFFLLLDEPELYGLPPDPLDTTRHLAGAWTAAGLAAATMAVALAGVIWSSEP